MAFIPFAATVGAWLGGSATLGGAAIATTAAIAAGTIMSATDKAPAPQPLPKVGEEQTAAQKAEAEKVVKDATEASEVKARAEVVRQKEIARRRGGLTLLSRAPYAQSILESSSAPKTLLGR